MGLESALLVDGGQSVVFQGRRVAPDLRGSGIAGALQRHVTAHVRQRYPEVCVARLSRGDQPSSQTLAKYRLVAKEVCDALRDTVGAQKWAEAKSVHSSTTRTESRLFTWSHYSTF